MIVGVKYKEQGKTTYVNSNIDVKVWEKVVIDSNKALFLVKVCEIPNNFDKEVKGDVVRVATKKDYDTYLKNLSLAKKALVGTKKIVKKSGLNMNIIETLRSYGFNV